MLKVLLIYEDLHKARQLRGDLKNLGLEAQCIGNITTLFSRVSDFSPDVIAAYGGQKMTTMSIATELKKRSLLRAKLILIFSQGATPPPGELGGISFDATMEFPLTLKSFLETLIKVCDQNTFSSIKKATKLYLKENPQDTIQIKENLQKSEENQAKSSKVITDKKRMDRYKKIIAGVTLDTTKTSCSSEATQQRQLELQKGWDSSPFEEVDKLKQEFVTALFDKDTKVSGVSPVKKSTSSFKKIT